MPQLPEIADRESALAYLYAHINYERTAQIPYRSRNFKLDRMRLLLHQMGNPQDRLRIVHIAGTKGKGSCATLVASILESAGYVTGLFTSPHLERLEERFRINGQICSAAEFVGLVQQTRDAVRRVQAAAATEDDAAVTYFELTTALAFQYFAQRCVDLAVVEVGLGGRLDSTNVCQAIVSVITSISLDHTRQLGETLELIAAEKAGIIKPGTPVISGVTATAPAQVIAQIAQDNAAPLSVVRRDFSYEYLGTGPADTQVGKGQMQSRLNFRDWRHQDRKNQDRPDGDRRNGTPRAYDDLRIGLLGSHQASNAAVALAVIGTLEELGWTCEESAIRRGLAKARCPARIELIAQTPTTILDTAHNLASVHALIEVLTEAFSAPRRILIFSTSRDKNARQMLTRLLPHFDEVVLTRFQSNPRSRSPHELAGMARELATAERLRISISDEPAEAWQAARRAAGADDLICITGSFFLASEIRRFAETQPV